MFNFRQQALKRKIQSDPYYRFQSLEEVAIAAELGVRIEVNQATVDEWLRLPGLSIHQARQIVALTTLGMQFLSLEDLAAALSLASQQLQSLSPILSFTYRDLDSLMAPSKIAVNHCSVEQLMTIPQMQKAIARVIISERQTRGPFRHLADFQRRLTLPTDFISHVMHYLQF